MKKLALITALGLSGLTIFSQVNAQYVGKNSSQFTDLAVLIESGEDDDYVLLEGKLTSKVGKEKYIFSDGKQEIRVEIDNEYFPREPFDENATIRIEGELEKDFMESPEIDVDRLTIVKR